VRACAFNSNLLVVMLGCLGAAKKTSKKGLTVLEVGPINRPTTRPGWSRGWPGGGWFVSKKGVALRCGSD
jgi:hypothetical protein